MARRKFTVTAGSNNDDIKRAARAEAEWSERLSYKNIERIADELAQLLDDVSRMDNVNDYLDEYDLDHIGSAVDALYVFAQMKSSDLQMQELDKRNHSAKLDANTVFSILQSAGLSTEPHQYEVKYCESYGMGALYAPEIMTTTWEGDFIALWMLASKEFNQTNDAIGIICEYFDYNVDEFEAFVAKYRNKGFDKMFRYYGDADQDEVIYAVNLDTGKRIVDYEKQFKTWLKENPGKLVY